MKAKILGLSIFLAAVFSSDAGAKLTVRQRAKGNGAYLMTSKGARSLKRITRAKTIRGADGVRYKVAPTERGTVTIRREWTFGLGKTKAAAIWEYDLNGKQVAYSRSTGSLDLGKLLTTTGWSQENGQIRWRMHFQKNPIRLFTHGVNSAGVLKESFVASSGYYRHVNRDGTVDEAGPKPSAEELAVFARLKR
jgi:hypothetical protein